METLKSRRDKVEPLISIIIPAYNVSDYLPRCLDSVLIQSYTDFEVIIIDDGSTDNTPQICDEYAERDKRVRVLHKENEGVAAARNAGLDMVVGEYIMFVDADDWIHEDALRIMYDRIVADHSDLAIGRHVDVFSDGAVSDLPYKWIQDDVLTPSKIFEMIGKNKRFATALWGKLYKREIIIDIRVPNLRSGEDTWVFPQIIANCKTISVVNCVVYFYFVRANSITHTMNQAVYRDAVCSHLRMTCFLLHNGYVSSAEKHFEGSISYAVKMQDKRSGRDVFLCFLSKEEIKKLLIRQSIKTKIKWLAMYLPFIYNVVCFFKKRKGVE